MFVLASLKKFDILKKLKDKKCANFYDSVKEP